jgi:hypothetical protein
VESAAARKRAGFRAALLNPIVTRTMPKTSERDDVHERIAAAEESRFGLTEYWRGRRDSS